MKTITHLMPIKRYEGPQWFVEPAGQLDPAEERQLIMDIGESFDVIDTNIRGWGKYNAIIQYEDDLYSPGWPTFNHYLATLGEDE